MKRFPVSGILLLLLSVAAIAQTTLSPTNLIQPGHNQRNWDLPLNQDINLLNQYLGGIAPLPAGLSFSGPIVPGSGTVTSLGGETPAVGALFTVLDSLFYGDCTIGGGTGITTTCRGTGTGWMPVSGLPGTTVPGAVFEKNCGGSALQGVDNTGNFTCAASSTGGNGGIYNAPLTTPHAGTGGYQVLYTYTLLGNTLSTTGGLDIYCGVALSGATANLEITFGGSVLGTVGQPISSPGNTSIHAHIYNNSALNSQYFVVEATTVNTSTGLAIGALNFYGNNLAVDTTASQAITCQVQQSSSGTNNGMAFWVNRAAQ